MNSARFLVDLELIPDRLGQLAESLDNPFAAAPLDGARELLLTGMGSSWFAAETTAGWLRAQGLPAVAERASQATGSPGGPGTVAVLISNSGTSVETLDRLARLAPGTFRIALTEHSESPLAQGCDLTVPLGSGVELGGVSCRSYRHTLALLLAIGLPAVRLQKALTSAAKATTQLLADRSWLDALDSALGTETPSYWLAPADRLGSALQGALMQREGPRLPATGCETGDWSHVDVYLTATTDYRAVLFTGSKWDAPALDWLGKRRSMVVRVGPGEVIDLPADPLAALLTEPLIAELLAQRRWARHPPVVESSD